MKELRIGVLNLIREELIRANKEFPLFRSDHEGVAVMEEEYLEAREDYAGIRSEIHALKGAIRVENDEAIRDIVNRIEMMSAESACELIQLAAMARKFRMSKSNRQAKDFSQEEADRSAEITPEAFEIPRFLRQSIPDDKIAFITKSIKED